MKNILKYALLALALSLTASVSAHADGWWNPWGDGHDHDPSPNTAPEVDPSMAIGGLALLAGTLTLVRSGRVKK